MLQSIGMSKIQLISMLRLECLYYVIFTSIFSCIGAAVAVSTGVKSYLVLSWTQTYHFTLLPIVLCIPVLILIAVIIPSLCFRKIESKSIVERLCEWV